MDIIQFIHSKWAYLVLIVLVLAAVNGLVKYFGDKMFGEKDFRISLFALITMHIQLLIGIVYFFMKDYFGTIKEMGGMGELMRNSDLRMKVIEHPTLMIVAVILVTMGYSKQKKKLTSRPKFKMLAIFYTLALICVLLMIPWKTWF